MTTRSPVEKSCTPGADRDDFTGRLMPEHLRISSRKFADAAVLIPVQIATADANGADSDGHFAMPGIARLEHLAFFERAGGEQLDGSHGWKYNAEVSAENQTRSRPGPERLIEGDELQIRRGGKRRQIGVGPDVRRKASRPRARPLNLGIEPIRLRHEANAAIRAATVVNLPRSGHCPNILTHHGLGG